MVEQLSAGSKEPVWTIGPLVHNPGVISALEKGGVIPVKNFQELKGKSAPVIVPTHGLGAKDIGAMSSKGLTLHDGTCPIVGNLQQKVKKLSRAGYAIIIFGDPEHPEVKGALGWIEKLPEQALATIDLLSVKQHSFKVRRIAILAQTTQTVSSYNKFCQDILKIFLPKMLEIKIMNTICPEVQRRQKATQELALSSDLMIIVGGKDSANTKRLGEICREAGAQVYLVEEAEEIKSDWLKSVDCLGIAAGTSTPQKSVEEVEKRVKALVS